MQTAKISMDILIFFVSKVAYQFYEVTMTITIYGRDNCSYCKRAVELAKQLKGHGYGDYEYIDITTAGIDKEKLSEIVGKPVETIPQVLIDGQPIGGYTELAAYVSTL